MLRGMTTVKIAISLPGALVERARSKVRKGSAASVSAYVAGALEQRAELEDLESMLREMLEESGGPLTAGERRAADEALGIALAPRRRSPASRVR